MSDKKHKARIEMLKKLAKEKASDVGGIGEGLKKTKKVEVIAKDEKGLQKGLSLAQKLMKAKFGDKVDETEDPAEENCPICGEPLADHQDHEESEDKEDSEEEY